MKDKRKEILRDLLGEFATDADSAIVFFRSNDLKENLKQYGEYLLHLPESKISSDMMHSASLPFSTSSIKDFPRVFVIRCLFHFINIYHSKDRLIFFIAKACRTLHVSGVQESLCILAFENADLS